MPLKDQIKNYATKLVEQRPAKAALRHGVRRRRPSHVFFPDDGIVPNNPKFPVLHYRGAVTAPPRFRLDAVMDSLFENNGWTRSWRDTVYDFVHYHSQVHEVLGIARGSAEIECGGIKGRVLKVKAGDVVVLPAGTGHRLISASRNFLVVGAYPKDGAYDECTDTRQRAEAIKRIAKVRKPEKDPIYGRAGPLIEIWSRRSR